MNFKHFSQPLLSVFQSLGDEMAEHFDRKGKTEPVDSPDKRPHSDHSVKAVIEHIADLFHRDEDIPTVPPPSLVSKVGSAVHEVWDCANFSLRILHARYKKDPQLEAEVREEFKFSTCDPRWAEALDQYWKYFGIDGCESPIPYVRYQHMSDFVLPILPRNARIGLWADWGTGTDDARRVLLQLARHEVDVLLHLGDIYYSGTAKECKEYFLDIVNETFPQRLGDKPIPLYTLPGNHDMYDGGAGYYGLLPQLNPAPTYEPQAAQPASYFSLRSPGGTWQLLCMDTALHDHDPFTVTSNVTFLDPDEEAWHEDKIREWSRDGGRTILFSHNQLFTAFDTCGQETVDGKKEQLVVNPKLQESYRKFKRAAHHPGSHERGAIAGWFWGHEHNLCVFEPYVGLDKGRCIGHGAVPVTSDPYKAPEGIDNLPQLVDDPRKPGEKLKLDKVDKHVYAHGFVILELNDDEGTAEARYYQETDPDTPMYVETL